jgi:DNA-binding response OmpR family regulator
MPDTRSDILSRLRVLVADENRSMRDLLRGMLLVLGVEDVRDCATIDRVLPELEAYAADLLILDWPHGERDGLQLVRRLRRHPESPAPLLPVLMLTGHAEAWRVRAARDAGVTEFLAKPVSPQVLTARLESILRRPRPFIHSFGFVGPDRRRRPSLAPGAERRGRAAKALPDWLTRQE